MNNNELNNIDKPDFYCDVILKGELEINRVIETDYSLAYHHTNPFWEHHVVVIPKKHIRSFNTILEEDRDYIEDMFRVIREVATKFERDYEECQINTNMGKRQSNRHLHVHLIAGKQLRDEKTGKIL